MIFKRPFGRHILPEGCVLACVLALGTILSPATKHVSAQSTAQWAPIVVAPEEPINLFADWQGNEAADGVIVETSHGWEVLAVEAVRQGRNTRTAFSLKRSIDGVVAESSERFFGRHRLIVTVRSPRDPSSSTISVTPATWTQDAAGSRLVPQNSHQFEFSLNVDETRPPRGRALQLSSQGAEPVVVELADAPTSGSASGFTAAFWLKAIDRDKIVMSSWTGNEAEDYGFEFVINASGEMRVYSGHGGMHYSLGSKSPVADGSWHHVAYSVNFSTGLALMTIDGTETDSRFLPNMGHVNINRLTLGERENGNRFLGGLIDEIAVLPTSRSPEEISRTFRIPVAAIRSEPGTLLLDFEPRPGRPSISGLGPDAVFSVSDLTLHQPATEIVAEFHPGTVLLSWLVERAEPQVITVERSRNGVQFEPIHKTTIDRLAQEQHDSREFYSFEDFVSEDSPIYFYRITQEFTDLSTIQSQMIKIGFGAREETPFTIDLVGNSPNPFSTSTEVYIQVHEPTSVRLSVWSVSGHLIEVLVSETRDTGLHRIPFQAGALPSGTYFVRMETERGVQSHKMIVRR